MLTNSPACGLDRGVIPAPDTDPKYFPPVGKARGDLRRVCADWLHDLSASRRYLVYRRSYAIDHDVDQQADISHWWTIEPPRAAYLADAVVKRFAAVAAGPDVPAEDFLVKCHRAFDIGRRDFYVTDFSVTECWLSVVAHI